MAQGEIDSRRGGESSGLLALIYDPRIRAIVFQTLLLLAVFGTFAWIIHNTISNLAALDKKSGFGFLGQQSGFQILTTPGTWAVDFKVGNSTYLDVFWIGVVNTMSVSLMGIIAATVIGFVVGVFRLSSNVLLNGFATIYVELLRNVPLLLQLFIWYKVVLDQLPGTRDEPVTFFGGLYSLDKSGLWGPYPLPQDGFWLTMVAVVVGVLAWVVIAAWAKARKDRTGQPFPTFWVGLAIFIAIPVATFLSSGAPLGWEFPERGNFGFKLGLGMVMKPEMFAVWLALTLYTASFIAEIVRAGILAVNRGQTEAAFALGLRPQSTLGYVVIPQALRVIIPPLTSQYLNLTKNSSLSVAIAYPDVVSVFAGTSLNQVGQEIEMIFMMMMVYLVLSLSISLFMNWYNKRIALVER